MSVGFSADKTAIDTRAGALATQGRDWLAAVVNFKAWLDSVDDEFLTGLNYNANDITLLRASFTDLANLAAVAHAQQAQASANDFFYNAKHLTGVN